MKEILAEAIQAPQCLKFISNITSIAIASKDPRLEFADPKCEVYIKVEAECFEHMPGEKLGIKTRVFSLDLDKKIFYWPVVADRYLAINHDEMFEICKTEVEKSIQRKLGE